ncbi:riboflavin synthase [Zeimonas arvi]|uniref:Riboflavin synthase n=1 Tax=Zeimonas arvi TaxID=2498847 RepID=A0A5C8NZ97_9BURK|nr:riboflavin synthase [Zeimonas arvi]TXL66391.1 riboflavin synthase [Zeimonas arvi]
MFTGIVAAVGRIESIESLAGGAGAGVRLTVHAGALDLSDVAIGDSIAIQGACMTAVRIDGPRFAVDVSRESLSKTVGLDAPGEVNLEKALRLADRLGGHLVSGHVDGLGEVACFEPVGESWLLAVRAPRELGKYLAYKGSITVNGASLTVNRVVDEDGEAGGALFEINLIPHTIEATTLKSLKPGARVNLEVDLIARYVERMLSQDRR